MSLNVSVIVRALIRWSWVLVLFLIVGYVVGKFLSGLLPPQYQATSLVQLNGQAHSALVVQPVSTYANLITGDAILGTVLKENFPKLEPSQIGTKQLTITPDDKSSSISIQVSLPSGKDAAALANDLAQLLVTQQNAVIQQEYTLELKLINGHITSDKNQINALNAKIIQLSSVPNGATVNATAIQQLQNQVNQYQSRESSDETQQQQLVTDQTLYSNPLSVVQTATIPSKPSGITGAIPLAPLSLGVMFVLALTSIFFLEKWAKRINGVYSLQKSIGLPVLGALRWTSPPPASVPLRTLIESKRPYAEECRVMMADVLFHAEDAQARVLAITSQKSHSGNSSVASELAALLAQSKRRVLLIDANLHSPVQHKRLGIPNDAGLAKMLEELRNVKVSLTSPTSPEPVEMRQQPAISMMETRRVSGVQSNQAPVVKIHQQRYSSSSNGNSASEQKVIELADKFPFDSYIVSTNITNLYAMPAGKSTMNAASLLSMPEMEHFLQWASRPIDFVVIDCPSLAYAEAHVLGALSDQTFLVVDATRDRIKQVETSKEELLSTGVRLSGLIVNKLGRWI